MCQKAKISDSFLALIKRKLNFEPLSRSCHAEVLQKKKLQNPINLTWMLYPNCPLSKSIVKVKPNCTHVKRRHIHVIKQTNNTME